MVPQSFAFAFDIDGVLVQDGVKLPGASQTLLKLQANRIPYIFLTNRFNVPDRNTISRIEYRLNMKVHPEQFVQKQTPWKEFAPELRDKAVLVFGAEGEDLKGVEMLRDYGYNNIIMPSYIYTRNPEAYLSSGEYTRRPSMFRSARTTAAATEAAPLSTVPPISAIFCIANVLDSGREMNLIMDLLLSKQGQIGTVSELNGNESLKNRGYLQDGQPTIHICRKMYFGQGRNAHCLKDAIQEAWAAKTGNAKLQIHEVGKPFQETFAYAEKTLLAWSALNKSRHPDFLPPEIKTVYMVGDTPQCDVAGANAFKSPEGIQWKSILVQTGEFKSGDMPSHDPTVIVKGVAEAIKWAIKREEFNAKWARKVADAAETVAAFTAVDAAMRKGMESEYEEVVDDESMTAADATMVKEMESTHEEVVPVESMAEDAGQAVQSFSQSISADSQLSY